MAVLHDRGEAAITVFRRAGRSCAGRAISRAA